jgi:hypothetical protein
MSCAWSSSVAADSNNSRWTIAVVLGITATMGWLGFTFWQTWTVGHVSVGEICLVHVGRAEEAMPTVCVTADADDRVESRGIKVILSRDHLIQLGKSIDEHTHEQPPDRTAFGTYEIHDAMHAQRNGRMLSNAAVRAVLRRLLQLTEVRSMSIEMDRLAGVVMALELNSATR